MAIFGEPDAALTSDPMYPSTLISGLFGPGRGCYIGYSLGNQILHLPVTLCTQRYCLISHLVLGESISYWGTGPALTNVPSYMTILFPEPFGPGRGCGERLGEALKISKCLSWWKILLSA